MSNPVSDAARAMQRKSAASRWGDMTAEQRSAAMKALRAKGTRKKRTTTRKAP